MKIRAALACEASALLSRENVGLHGLRAGKVLVQIRATGSCGRLMGRDVALARQRQRQRQRPA